MSTRPFVTDWSWQPQPESNQASPAGKLRARPTSPRGRYPHAAILDFVCDWSHGMPALPHDLEPKDQESSPRRP